VVAGILRFQAIEVSVSHSLNFEKFSYGKKTDYIAKFLEHIDWVEANKRFQSVG